MITRLSVCEAWRATDLVKVIMERVYTLSRRRLPHLHRLVWWTTVQHTTTSLTTLIIRSNSIYSGDRGGVVQLYLPKPEHKWRENLSVHPTKVAANNTFVRLITNSFLMILYSLSSSNTNSTYVLRSISYVFFYDWSFCMCVFCKKTSILGSVLSDYVVFYGDISFTLSSTILVKILLTLPGMRVSCL